MEYALIVAQLYGTKKVAPIVNLVDSVSVGDRMKQGTVSILFGCHSIIHSLLVIIAWHRWYKHWPNFWQFICILLHDVGHYGKQYLDDAKQKERHSVRGALIAGALFGEKGYDLVIGHNEYNGHQRSELFYADKYAMVIAPIWWVTFNNIIEPKLIRPGTTRRESAILFNSAMRENMKTNFQEKGHDIYLKQMEKYKNAEGK